MNKTKQIVLLALLMAAQVAVSFFYIPVADNLRIYFTYLVVILVANIFPFKVAILYAFIEDILAFMIYPTGPFFIGYTLTAVAAMVIYSLCLYQKVNLKRIIIAKVSVNLLVNVGLNSLWSAMLYSKGYLYYMTASLVKNVTLLPIEILIIMLFYKLVKPLLIKYELLK